MSTTAAPLASAPATGITAVAKGKGTVVNARKAPTSSELAGPKSKDDVLGDELQRMEDRKRNQRNTANKQRKSSAAAAKKQAAAELRAHELGKAAGQKVVAPEVLTATPPVTAPSSPVEPMSAEQQPFGGKNNSKKQQQQRGNNQAVAAH